METGIYSDLAISAPEILLPARDADLPGWPVIACDQYTSEPAYWEETERLTAGVPSAFHMILPEVYLETLSRDLLDAKIDSINLTMSGYLANGTLKTLPSGFILTDRSTHLHPSRKGLVLAVDLEEYDFTPGNKKKIRATEGTVLSRIPPRVRIRRDAPLEVPHIMLLIDDPDFLVIDPALRSLRASGRAPIYDIDLMQNGGHIRGYYTEAGSVIAEGITCALSLLLDRSADGLLFAVGDGNHSLATAKAHWEKVRESLCSEDRNTHPARFALVEVVNIHDAGLCFEPIHRVAFGLSPEEFYAAAGRFFADRGFMFMPEDEWYANKPSTAPGAQVIGVVSDSDRYVAVLNHPEHTLAVGSLQNMLDRLLQERRDVRIDYIHGEDSVLALSTAGNTGFLLPAIPKDSFFRTVTTEGVFPRKTFSMGEAFEKRYYMEAKRITRGETL
jgi:hypothetical protein